MDHLDIIFNLLKGKTRYETLEGVKYIVAPVTMIVPGVLNGSDGPLYYPPSEVTKNVAAWNHIPVVVYHPTDWGGKPISARTPEALEKHKVGVILNAHTVDSILQAEAWFDIEKTKLVDNRVLEALKKNEQMEVSTGLGTRKEQAPKGAVYNGTPYAHVATDYQPDHLAVLPDQKGACSLKDGCGLMVANASGLSHEQVRRLLGEALRERFAGVASTINCPGEMGAPMVDIHVVEVFQKSVVYWHDGKLYELKYTIKGNKVSLAKDTPVQVQRVSTFKVVNTTDAKPEQFAFVGDTNDPETWNLRLDSEDHIINSLDLLSTAQVAIPRDRVLETQKRLRSAWLTNIPGANETTLPPIISNYAIRLGEVTGNLCAVPARDPDGKLAGCAVGAGNPDGGGGGGGGKGGGKGGAGKKGFIGRMKEKVGGIAQKVGQYWGVRHVKGFAGKVMGGIKNKLAARYGENVAKAIMAGGFVGGYGVLGAAQAFLGFPGIPVVNDVIAIGVLTGFAEAGRQLGIIKAPPPAPKPDKKTNNIFAGLNNVTRLTPQQALKISKAVWADINRQVVKEMKRVLPRAQAEAKKFLSTVPKEEKATASKGLRSLIKEEQKKAESFTMDLTQTTANATRRTRPLDPLEVHNLNNFFSRELTMELTQEDRNGIIENLVGNCSCWQEEGDREVLNGFSDAKLLSLQDGLKPKQKTATTPAPTTNSNPATPTTPTTNSGQSGTMEDWLNQAPPEIQRTIKAAASIVNSERETVINSLVATVPDAEKEGMKNFLKTKELEDLKMMQKLKGVSAPTGNSTQSIASQVRQATPTVPTTPVPTYDGAATLPTGNGTVTNSEGDDDVLELPTLNWAEAAN